MNSTWFIVEHYHNTHSTQYRCTHYTLLSTVRCFQSVCNSVTPWCVILFSTNSRPLVHPLVNCPSEPHQSSQPPAGTFSWNADCIFKLDFDFLFKFPFDICRFLATWATRVLVYLAFVCIFLSFSEYIYLYTRNSISVICTEFDAWVSPFCSTVIRCLVDRGHRLFRQKSFLAVGFGSIKGRIWKFISLFHRTQL
jgi:hypothetical protein